MVNMAAVVAVRMRRSGEREILGFNVGASETYESGSIFCASWWAGA